MPSGNDQVGVTTVSHSDAVTFEHEQHGNRIALRAISSRLGTSLVDFSVIVPADAFVTVRSSDAAVHVRGLHGDIVLEALTGTVEAADINNAHLHVKTLSGPITLTNIRDSHVDVRSVNGDVNLLNVSGSSLEVNSGSGRIKYDGDPGSLGEYLLTSHSGDLEVSIPAKALVEIKAHSLKGESDHAQPSLNACSPGKSGESIGETWNSEHFPICIALISCCDPRQAALTFQTDAATMVSNAYVGVGPSLMITISVQDKDKTAVPCVGSIRLRLWPVG